MWISRVKRTHSLIETLYCSSQNRIFECAQLHTSCPATVSIYDSVSWEFKNLKRCVPASPRTQRKRSLPDNGPILCSVLKSCVGGLHYCLFCDVKFRVLVALVGFCIDAISHRLLTEMGQATDNERFLFFAAPLLCLSVCAPSIEILYMQKRSVGLKIWDAPS